jgi:translation elongation factor EF-G
VAISPRNNSDHEKFQQALSVLVQEDPTIQIKTKSIGGQTILSGMKFDPAKK